jgi:hypothetical protein
MSALAVIIGSLLTITSLGCIIHKTRTHRKSGTNMANTRLTNRGARRAQQRVYEREWHSADQGRVNEMLGQIRNPGSMVVVRGNSV